MGPAEVVVAQAKYDSVVVEDFVHGIVVLRGITPHARIIQLIGACAKASDVLLVTEVCVAVFWTPRAHI